MEGLWGGRGEKGGGRMGGGGGRGGGGGGEMERGIERAVCEGEGGQGIVPPRGTSPPHPHMITAV